MAEHAAPDQASLRPEVGPGIAPGVVPRGAMAAAELEAVFDALPALIFLIGADDTFSDYRAGRGIELFAAPESFLGRGVDEVLPRPLGTDLRAAMGRCRTTRSQEILDYCLPFPAGTRHFEARLVPLDGGRVAVLVTESTARKQAEEALRRSEERLRVIIESEPECVKVVGRDGQLLEMNPSGLAMLEARSLAEVGTRALAEYVTEETRPAFVDLFRSVLRGGRGKVQFEVTGLRGTRRWLETHAVPLRDEVGDVVALLGVTRDITAWKVAEEALRDSEERFRIAFQTSPDSININRLDDGVFVAVNEGFTWMTGWSQAEALGRSSLELHVWDDPADRARLVAGLKKDGYVQNLEARFRKKDGRVLSGLMSARLIGLRGQPHLLSITRDVSDWKRAEEERDRLKSGLYQAAKMEAIGQLAGGVAHDFNNLLTVILAGAEVLRHDLGKDSPPDSEIVEEIGAAGRRAQDLTRQLLAFARRQVIAPIPLDLNTLMRSSEKLLRRVLGEDIELVTILQPDLWTVCCDPGQMEQVVLNLAVNAESAMPSGGRLTIETNNIELDEDFTSSHQWIRSGPYVRLSIRDSGQGMPPEVKEHLFEPFFTTKPVGQGTGLGLATVYGIVKQSEGHILVESEPGHGTTFEVFFPRITESPAAVTPPAPAAATDGTEAILVVEDDPQVREVTVRSLRAGGYRVLVAADGREALDVAGHDSTLRLLVTDVVMPGMSGREVADELCRRRPTLRVLYVSGYTHDAIAQRGVLDSGVEFLQKPFTASSLLARVRAILDAR
jgi:two-component system cell cycle sensor histidine kinase/response regulator CckA